MEMERNESNPSPTILENDRSSCILTFSAGKDHGMDAAFEKILAALRENSFPIVIQKRIDKLDKKNEHAPDASKREGLFLILLQHASILYFKMEILISIRLQ